MATPDNTEKRNAVLRRVFDLILELEAKKGEFSHSWISSPDGFSFSPEDANVRQQIQAQKIPSIQISRQEFPEVGSRSGQRTCLRLMRKCVAIVAFASPFQLIPSISSLTKRLPTEPRPVAI